MIIYNFTCTNICFTLHSFAGDIINFGRSELPSSYVKRFHVSWSLSNGERNCVRAYIRASWGTIARAQHVFTNINQIISIFPKQQNIVQPTKFLIKTSAVTYYLWSLIILDQDIDDCECLIEYKVPTSHLNCKNKLVPWAKWPL